MKQSHFTFSVHRFGKFKLGNYIVAIKPANVLQAAKTAGSRIEQLLRCSTLCKMGAALGIAVAATTSNVTAQCTTFYNADSANPIARFVPAGQYISGLDFVDIDGDGDLDCYAKIVEPEPFENASFHMNPLPTLFRNIGNKKFPVYKPDAAGGFETTGDNDYLAYSDIQFADLDGDGDYDCFIAETYRSYFYGAVTNIHYYENTGTPQKPHFVANDAKNPLAFAQSFYGIEFTLADIDSDGDLDLNYKSAFSSYGYTYLNTGTKTQPQYIFYSETPHERDVRTYYDWNHDGLPDYFIDNPRSIDYYRNIGPREEPTYILDTKTGPTFGNGAPYRFVDLTDDGSPEVFAFSGEYSTLAPVAVIRATAAKTGNRSYTLLSTTTQLPGYKYQWKFNRTNIPGATHPNFPAFRNGVYTLFITDSCGTGQSLPYVVKNNTEAHEINRNTADLPVNISASLITAYPNPFPSEVIVRIHQPVTKSSLVVVTDVVGKIVFSKETSDATIALGNTLKPGVYFLQVKQNGNVVFTQKLIKE